MQLWYAPDGTPIDALAADQLLRDDLARRVLHTTLHTGHGIITISTIFLVLDHNLSFVAGGVPVLWETMVFGGPADMHQWRYHSRDDAERGHTAAVVFVRSALDTEGTAVVSEDTFTGRLASTYKESAPPADVAGGAGS